MKLIIQIPCLNEEQTLPETVADLPRYIEGIDEIEYLVIDDGSTDRTVQVARQCGVHHIVRLPNNRGLARAFESGLDACLKLGADIIVNTDADNQYKGQDIPLLLKPILYENADMVIGDRRTDTIQHFSFVKKRLQKLGSRVVRFLSETEVADATSGFRAYKREAAMSMNVVSPFTYTLETLIQAGKKQMAVASVPIGTNAPTRPSRLFRGIPQYIRRSGATMVRMYLMYQPLRVFIYLSMLLIAMGLFLIGRWIYYHFSLGMDAPLGHHIQSLTVGVGMLVVGFITGVLGLLADLVNFNRRLIENTQVTVRNIELNLIEKGLVRWGAGYLAHSTHPDYKTKDKSGYQPQRVRRPTTVDIPALRDHSHPGGSTDDLGLLNPYDDPSDPNFGRKP
ncbi:MAG: glycosyltransferase family 2 protein [Bradymonadia bacterium]